MRFAAPGKTQPPSPEPPQVSFPDKFRSRLPRWWMTAGLVALVILLVAGFLLLSRPAPPVLTGAAFEKAVETYLRKRPYDPSPANVAFAVIHPSLIVVQGKDSLGAGIVVDEAGTILTCLHVVAGAERITVTFSDGFESEAHLVSVQPENDLAVLRPDIVPENLVPAILAGTADLHIGDPVVAVGNPFGLVASVSEGVVSGLGRTASTENGIDLKNLIQFDAAVNPGNSGGPLLNRRGEVIGLVTALVNPVKQGFFVGIGYAITIETAGRALEIPPW